MVEIITDSSVLYTEEDAKAAGFEAISMCVHIGDMEGRDLKIDMEEFYRRIAEGQVPRSSSRRLEMWRRPMSAIRRQRS